VKPPWSPERVVSAGDAGAAIDEQFPELSPATCEPIAEGWDNTAFRVNGRYLFRFPRREVAVALLETEARVLPRIRDRLPLRVPEPVFFGRPGRRFPWPFLGHPLVPGSTVPRAAWSDRDRARAAPVLGRFLAALHAIDPGEARGWGVAPDELGRLEVSRRAPQARENLERIRSRGLLGPERFAAFGRVLDAAGAFAGPRSSEHLVHGDLYAGQILVGDRREIIGVIDWGDTHLGDPASDLAVAHSLLPPPAHDSFRRAYGEIAEERWSLARFRAIHHTAYVVLYGAETGNRELAREGLRALGYIAEALATG
jgi:aminoglycoside phosphotransferase (APT) family kinase protein